MPEIEIFLQFWEETFQSLHLVILITNLAQLEVGASNDFGPRPIFVIVISISMGYVVFLWKQNSSAAVYRNKIESPPPLPVMCSNQRSKRKPSCYYQSSILFQKDDNGGLVVLLCFFFFHFLVTEQ